MAESDNSSWSGLQGFVNAVFGGQSSSSGGLDKIAMGMLNKTSAHPKPANQPVLAPDQQKPVVGPGAPGIINQNGVVAGPMSGLPQTPIVKPQQLAPLVSATGKPGMVMPAANPITNMTQPGIAPVSSAAAGMPQIGSVPQTSNPFITGTPNPSGAQVS